MKIRLNGTIGELSAAPKGNIRMRVVTDAGSFEPIVTPHVAVAFMPGTVVDVEIRDGITDPGLVPTVMAREEEGCEFCELDAHGTHAERCPISLESTIADYETQRVMLNNKITHLDARIVGLLAQLPEGMKDCTIGFKECDKGHSWLVATNWTDHGCPYCKIVELGGILG